MTAIAHIGIGSNVGDPQANVAESILRLESVGQVVARSSLYLTKPWGEVRQADYLNAVVRIATDLTCRELLTGLKSIEIAMGRTETYRWGPRLIDLDILTFDSLTIKEADLEIPHPYMLERLFVLVPLAEIDSSYSFARDKLLASLPAGEQTPLLLK